MKKILLIGGTNHGNLPRGGEEYKNQLLYSYLAGKYITTLVDTHGWRKKPTVLLSLIFNLLFHRFDRIIISITTSSAYKLIKIIRLSENISSKTIYFVIGGNFPKILASGTFNIEYYRKLYMIIVEGNKLKIELNSSGLNSNVLYLPNFKPVARVYRKENQDYNQGKFRFVFVSSIIPEKGVTLILDAAKRLSLEFDLADKFTIDFWGPFESDVYRKLFEKAIENTSYCTYKGYLNIIGFPHESYLLLSEYDCLLFPSYYAGEGFPGVLLDASIAGLPVIASDWNMNSEVIRDGENGLVVETGSSEALFEAMKKMMISNQMLQNMRLKSNETASFYDMNKLMAEYLDPIL